MPLPRFRLTVRGSMAIVTMVALIFGGERLVRQSRAHVKRSEYHFKEMISGRAILDIQDNLTGQILVDRAECDKLNAYRKDFHRRWSLAYQRVASYPWLAIEAEPPEPDWCQVALGRKPWPYSPPNQP